DESDEKPEGELHEGQVVGAKVLDELRPRYRLQRRVGSHHQERIGEHHHRRPELAFAELDDGRQQLAKECVHVEDSPRSLALLPGSRATPSYRINSGPGPDVAA